MHEITDYLEIAARVCPDRVAGEAAGHRYTYAELHELSARLRELLGNGRGQRIGLVLRNSLSWYSVLSAVWNRDGVAVLFPASMPIGSLLDAAEREGVDTLVVDAARAAELDGRRHGALIAIDGLTAQATSERGCDQQEPGSAGAGVILFSSGTAGTPKAVLIPYSGLDSAVAGALASARSSNPRSTDDSRPNAHLIAFPLYHISGLFQLMLALARQAPAVVLDKFAIPGFLDALEKWPVRQLVLNPAMLLDLVATEDPRVDALVGHLRLVRSGTASLPDSLREAFCSRFDIPLLQGYGATETVGEIAGWSNEDARRHAATKSSSVGRSKPGVSIVIRDSADRPVEAGTVGRVAVRVPWVSDDWQEMDDLGYLDDDGFLFIVGRADDVINCGGFMIHPLVVEEALAKCSAVAECAVVSERDERLGEVPVAFVVPKEPGSIEDAVNAVAREHLLPYQCPRRIYVVDCLPRNEMGKVMRRTLRTDLAS